ncbi:flavodoxin domain-containing protein [Sinomonas sp. B1-1]|uniref:flavodoxin domain-containing protein n=1 Tax=Sinomonas sp. B1-1 TaxID=3141454 RepID=UPI003D2C812C
MGKVLIAYSTHEGQSAKVADFIAEVLRGRGLDATVSDIKESPNATPAGYDGVIVGGSIHMGKHDNRMVEYVRSNLEALSAAPSAFFSVSLSSHGEPEEAEGYVKNFEEQTGWRPDSVAMFSGGLPYTHMNFILRHMMKKIVEGKPGSMDTDTSRDYVYTEWDGVRRFAEDFAAQLAPAAS